MPNNVYIIGQTGVGKSELINAVFNQDIAKTGIGEPITNNITVYGKNINNIKWNFYDTIGISNENCDNIYTDIYNRIIKNKNQGINCDIVWICINESNSRVEESERNIIKKFIKYNLPFIVVLTKAFYEENLENKIKEEFSPTNITVIRIISSPYEIENGTILGPLNIDKLFNKTKEILTKFQKIDKNVKNNISKKEVIENKTMDDLQKEVIENKTMDDLQKEVIENKTMDDLPKVTNSEGNNEPLELIRIETMKIVEKNAISIGILSLPSKKDYEEIVECIKKKTIKSILKKFNLNLNENLINDIILKTKNSIEVKKNDEDLCLRLIPSSLLISNHISVEKANYMYRFGQTFVNVIYKFLTENNNKFNDSILTKYIIATINGEEKNISLPNKNESTKY